ncbi:carboxylesterase [Infundibulicybe gibba]|nr:carboxylesterase [Infundibulicybe gibba]
MKSLFLILFGVLLAAKAQNDGLRVQTHEGDVVGTLVTPNVRQFLGIPYAIADRWESPKSPPIRKSAFEATKFGDSCIQTLSPSTVEFLKLVAADQPVQESEDCLSINIWAPSVKRKQRTAVLLWIYGGGFTFGTSNIDTYQGQNLVGDNDDILLVTFNYRLNIFGQPGAPQLASAAQGQNLGLLDLDSAIQWVHANIAAFGGDPERITIFGQSAGSVAVDAYTFSHPKDTVVKGVIQQSGRYLPATILPQHFLRILITPWNLVSLAVGCGNETTPEQLTCMKAVPFRTLEDAVIKTNASFGLITDNITIFADTAARSAAGNFLHVPLLVGSTAQEGDIFLVSAELTALGTTLPSLTTGLSDLMTQSMFTCHASGTASDRVKAGVPTWRYQYQAIFPDISSRSDLRAYHASEIPIVFGTYNSSTFAPPTPVEVVFSKFVQGAWVSFARNPSKGLTDIGWTQFNPNTATVAQLGNSQHPAGITFARAEQIDGNCALAGALGNVVNLFLGIIATL